MPNAHDQFPASFDVGQLLEPQPDTMAEFQRLCTDIDGISSVVGSSREQSPDDLPGQHGTYALRKEFANGSTIHGHSTYGTQEWLEIFAEAMPIRLIALRTSDKIKYEYQETTDGSTLWVKKPGEKVLREELPKDEMSIDIGNGASLHMEGTPEFMAGVAADLSERDEVRKLGLDTPTDGNMKAFNKALSEALESGTVERPEESQTPPEVHEG